VTLVIQTVPSLFWRRESISCDFLLRRQVWCRSFSSFRRHSTNSIQPRLHVPVHSTVPSPSKLNTDILPSISTLLRLHTTRINILRSKLPQIQRAIPITPPANITPSRLNSHPQSSWGRFLPNCRPSNYFPAPSVCLPTPRPFPHFYRKRRIPHTVPESCCRKHR